MYVVRHTHTHTKGTTPIARKPRVGGERQTAIEHVLTCHSVTRLSSIVLLSTSGRIFKYRRVLFLGWKISQCKIQQGVNIKFLVKRKKSATETFQFLTEAYGEDSCLVHACLNSTNDFRKAQKAYFEVQVHVDCFL